MQSLRYRYDTIGNLLERTDLAGGAGTTERFRHDRLNRLIEWSVSGAALQGAAKPARRATTRSATFVTKSDVGTYLYGAMAPSGRALPHAVSGISGEATAEYSYDDNGNMLSGGGRNSSTPRRTGCAR